MITASGWELDLQIALDKTNGKILLNYRRHPDFYGIGAGILPGNYFTDDNASVLVEYIPGTGLAYAPE